MNAGSDRVEMVAGNSGARFCTRTHSGKIFCRLCENCGAGLIVMADAPASIRASCSSCGKNYLFRDQAA